MTDLPAILAQNPAPKSTNKLVYLLVLEDPTKPKKIGYFLTSKLNQNTITIEVNGFYVTDEKQIENIASLDDQKFADRQIISMIFPWQKVISIRNVTYRSKNG